MTTTPSPQTGTPRDEDWWICRTCAVEHATRPDVCAICADERQWVPATGQAWTTLAELAARRAARRPEPGRPRAGAGGTGRPGAAEHAPGPAGCAICADDRQGAPAPGQAWPTLAELAAAGERLVLTELEPDLFGLSSE